MAVLFGTMLGHTILAFLRLIRWFVSLHWRFPFYVFGAYVALIAFGQMTAGRWYVSLLLVAGYSLAVWKLWDKWQARQFRKRMFRSIQGTMLDTLWKDLPAHKFLAINVVSSAIIKVQFSTPPGRTDADVIKALPAFRAALRLIYTIVIPDEDPYDGAVTVLFCRTSPLEQELDGNTAPVLHDSEIVENPYYWLPVGVDARGEDMEIPLFIREGGSVRQLCAGASGSGKSSIARQQLLQATLCRYIDVVVLDGKGSEFTEYEPHVQQYGRSVSDFWGQLRFLEKECERRAGILRANTLAGKSRFTDGWNHIDDGNFLLWFWDELGAIMGGFDGSKRMEAMSRMYGVLSIARSLGIAVIFSSQTFKSDILTTQIRDNCFDLSLGYKMNSAQESAYIGFDSEDEIRPDLIRGQLLKSGKFSTVGTFALRGIGASKFGRSYFVPKDSLRKALKRAPLVSTSVDDSIQEESRKQNV